MNFDKLVESLIMEAQRRGEFENLPGKGKPIDLTAYFDTPEEIRVTQSILKNAGMAPREVDLLKEIAALKQILAEGVDEEKKRKVQIAIEKRQIEFNLMMERNRRRGRSW